MARTATTPSKLHAAAVTSGAVLIAWRRVPGAVAYVVYRGGRKVGTTHATRFNDRKVKPGVRYGYRVRARGHHRWLRPARRVLHVTVPKRKAPASGPMGGGSAGDGGGTPLLPDVGGNSPPTPTDTTVLTTAMVDRLFWRAGFGPSGADRQTWTGKTVGELVDHFLDTH